MDQIHDDYAGPSISREDERTFVRYGPREMLLSDVAEGNDSEPEPSRRSPASRIAVDVLPPVLGRWCIPFLVVKHDSDCQAVSTYDNTGDSDGRSHRRNERRLCSKWSTPPFCDSICLGGK